MIPTDFATSCNGPRTFVIADLHLGDERVARARGFANAAAMTAGIMAQWGERVSRRDTVYLLGDVAKHGHLGSLRALRGEKHLVCGNADNIRAALGMDIFAGVVVARWLPGFLLTHIPVHPSQLRGAMINVHGHLHGASIPDARYKCVSVDQTGFAPIPLTSLAGRLRQEALF